MSESVIIKCTLCKNWFDRTKYDDEPVVETCDCGNLTIEVKSMGDEGSLFFATYKEKEPYLKIPKIK
jgi:hypothetical protein